MADRPSLAVPMPREAVNGFGISDIAGISGSSSSSSAASSIAGSLVDGSSSTSRHSSNRANHEGSGMTMGGAAVGHTSNTLPSGSDGQVWMGAFERIMGDQDEHYQAKARSKHFNRSPDPSSSGVGGSSNGMMNGAAGLSSSAGTSKSDASTATNGALPVIRIAPSSIDFGTANVGARKSTKFAVENVSDVVARVEFRFISKVLTLDQSALEIAPHSSANVRIDFFPRRVNHTYRKQVTIANMLNRHNDQILEVRSQNVDEQRIGFHSLFYRILTSTGSNFLDFGDVNINCTRLRSFGIENVSHGPLTIELTAAQPEDFKLYVKAEQDSESETSRRGSQNAKGAGNEDSLSTTSAEMEPPKVNKAKLTAHLKERFLESMSQESPAVIRNENTTWRTAQKQRHFAKAGSSRADKPEKRNAGAAGSNAHGDQPPKRVNINLVSALKKGGKGRITMRYGKSMCFKDRTLLREFEPLDLAAGPPVDDKRINVKSKMYQHLEVQETGKDKPASKGRQAPDGSHKKSQTVKSANGQSIDASTQTTSIKATVGGKDAQHAEGSKKASSKPVPALTGKRKVAPLLYDAMDVSKLSLEELVTAVESQNCNLSTVFLGNSRAEEQLVRTEINLQRELNSAITEGRLMPIETITLGPGEEKQVLAIYTPNASTRPHIMGNARKQDSRIFIRILDFSTYRLAITPDLQHMLNLDNDELPVRELMVKSNLCRSLMELSQPHINFGHMHKGETKERKIVIQNRSEWALRYCIRKSGMIASGDIKIKSSDRYGVVPGHGKREVEFVFCPSLTGSFQERLVIENVADRDKDEVVLIKANVARLPNFSVEPLVVSFASDEDEGQSQGASQPQGDVLRLGEISQTTCSFVVSNVSAKPRTFVLHIDDDDLSFGAVAVDALLSLSRQEGDTRPTLSKAEEEEVETISQKLKIANRKGQADKIEKYQTRLSELGLAPPPSTSDAPQENSKDKEKAKDGEGDASPSSAPPAADSLPNGDSSKPEGAAHAPHPAIGVSLPASSSSSSLLKRGPLAVTLNVAPQQSKRLLVRLRPHLKPFDADEEGYMHPHHFTQPMDITIPVQVHELKNIDEVQVVEVRARIYPAANVGDQSASGVSDTALKGLLDQHQMSATEEGMVVFTSPASKSAIPQPPRQQQAATSTSPSLASSPGTTPKLNTAVRMPAADVTAL